MKYSNTALFFFIAITYLSAQTVASSCTAEESLTALYQFDATKLAIRQLYNNASPDTTAILVADTHKVKIMEALVAVHQAYELVARDEVINFFNIHALAAPPTNSFSIYADTSFAWVRHWLNGDILCQQADMDMWVDSFDLAFAEIPEMVFHESTGTYLLHANLQTAQALNLKPLIHELTLIPGVIAFAETMHQSSVQKDITYSYDSLENTATLSYFYKWGNCETGCDFEHLWNFQIRYEDCSVTFMDDSGDPLLTDDPEKIIQIAISPNPTSDQINISIVGPPQEHFDMLLYDAFGRLLRKKVIAFHNGLLNVNMDLSALPRGLYLVSFIRKNQILTKPIIKK
ncbi:MAG TPA: T9SS type A sorting domain-containing protein, partial [Phaeodactylibacter sp.]|nr:T9SS type A sorting domain-containing protein [Phaeodactylibacter sp.]